MNSSYEPHRLVIQNLTVLEAAAPIAENVEKEVFGAIDKKIKSWAEAQPGNWEGEFQYFAERDAGIQFKPESWPSENNRYMIHYSFDRETLPNAPAYFLTSLLGNSSARMGFFVIVNAPWIAGNKMRPMVRWKTYLTEKFYGTSLPERGYELSDEEWLFLPIPYIDARQLALNYPASIDEALTPIDAVLAKLEAAHAEIDLFLKNAQAFFNAGSITTTP